VFNPLGLVAFLPLGIAVAGFLAYFWWVRKITDREDSRAHWRYHDWSDPDD
jgi:hypothetical protein